MMDGEKNVRRDEGSMLAKSFCAAIFVLLVIDAAVLVFYARTNARIEDIKAHNFTQILERSITESTLVHNSFADRARKIINQRSYELREMLSKLQFDSSQLESIQTNKIVLPSLPKLQAQLERLDSNGPSELGDTIKAYFAVEEELKALNNNLVPFDTFLTSTNTVDRAIRTVLEDINQNMREYYNMLLNLAETQDKNQHMLYNDMTDTLRNFNRSFVDVYNHGKNVKLNQVFDYEFLEFDRDFVPFNSEFGSHTGAWLSKATPEFKLRLPRVYYCSLRAYLYSDRDFGIRFQMVDMNYPDADALYTSSPVTGSFQQPVTFDELFTFQLAPERHKLALRIIAAGTATLVHISRKHLSCLSYRQFSSG